MPAHHVEAADAEKEGVAFRLLVAPAEVLGDAQGAVSGLRCQEMRLGAPDASGRRSVEPVPGSETTIAADVIIAAIGMRPDTSAFGDRLAVLPNGRLASDTATCQTAVPHVFAAGDAVNGPTDITRAVGEGRKAAHQIDAWLSGRAFDDWDTRLPVVDKAAGPRPPEGLRRVRADAGRRRPWSRPRRTSPRSRLRSRRPRPAAPPAGASTAPSAPSATRASRPARWTGASTCARVDQQREVRVGAVVVSTGFKLFPADLKPEYGFGRFKNVITGMQMDRLLAPTRPFNTILRPGDGKVPERIAYILCTGSRDETVGNPLCSRFCCMYSIKQNQLLMGALPLADVTVHYMDIRAPGQALRRVLRAGEGDGRDLRQGARRRRRRDAERRPRPHLRGHRERRRDQRRPSTTWSCWPSASSPTTTPSSCSGSGELAVDAWQYVDEPEEDLNPGQTSIPGVYVAGAASGAKDIADSILHAGAAAAQVAAHLERAKADPAKPMPTIELVPA